MTEEYAESQEQLPPLPESPHVIITPVPSTRLSPPRATDYTPTRLPQVQAITHAGPPPPAASMQAPPPQAFKPVDRPPGVGEMQSGWYYYCPPNTAPPNMAAPNQSSPILQVAEENPDDATETEAVAKRKRILRISGAVIGVVLLLILLLLVYFWWSGHSDYWYENNYDYDY